MINVSVSIHPERFGLSLTRPSIQWSHFDGLAAPSDGHIWRYTYYAGTTRLAVREVSASENKLYYLLTDHLGSTAKAVEANTNTVVMELRYRPWGEVRYSSGTGITDYTFTGQKSEMQELGLLFYQSRFFDPSLGRFIQADSIVPEPGNPLAWDRYAYVLNNPVKYIDPSGHGACSGPNRVPECDVIDTDGNGEVPFRNPIPENDQLAIAIVAWSECSQIPNGYPESWVIETIWLLINRYNHPNASHLTGAEARIIEYFRRLFPELDLNRSEWVVFAGKTYLNSSSTYYSAKFDDFYFRVFVPIYGAYKSGYPDPVRGSYEFAHLDKNARPGALDAQQAKNDLNNFAASMNAEWKKKGNYTFVYHFSEVVYIPYFGKSIFFTWGNHYCISAVTCNRFQPPPK